MTPDQTSDDLHLSMPPRPRRRGLGPRHVLFAGVAGACLLGVGLGLWARPAMSERQASATPPADAAPPKPVAAARQLEIVVDDRPAPVGAPIDVLPAAAANRPPVLPQRLPAARAPDLSPPAPVVLPPGLMRVHDRAPPEAVAAPERPPAARPVAPKLAQLIVAALTAPKPAPAKVEPPAPKPAHVAQAHVAPAHLAPVHLAPVHLAKATPAPSKPLRLAKAAPVAPKPAHAIKAAPAPKIDLARAAAAKAAAHKVELAQAAQAAKAAKAAARAERAEQVRLAQAEARGRAEAKAEARAEALAEAREDARKKMRLASLVHAIQHALPHPAKARAPTPPVEVAKAERRHGPKSRREARMERASLKAAHRPPRLVEPPVRVRAAPPPPPARASGLMKVSAPRCANRDPGEALVCADPSLGAAERQLSRAYQSARAAGVPDAQLQHQQQRWLAARSAAAREAPWAVHDVYLARIAELNSQARDVHGDGY